MEAQTQMQVPVFNGKDHEIWSIKMRTLLMSRDLWDVVESGLVSEGQKDLKLKDMTALHMLQMSVTDSIFLLIGRATSSKQAWELLKASFGDTDEIRGKKRLDLDKEFFNTVMRNEESVHEFNERYMEVVNRYKFYGESMPDQMLINDIVGKLPSRFDETTLRIRFGKKLTLADVWYILREAERRNGFKKPEEAPHNHKTSKCYSNGKR